MKVTDKKFTLNFNVQLYVSKAIEGCETKEQAIQKLIEEMNEGFMQEKKYTSQTFGKKNQNWIIKSEEITIDEDNWSSSERVS
jgi:hypothetical protein|tara:strand:- start:2542 stop:2790 length:249 start_codon:yes stop_codon:yes gene_type:complete